MEKDELLATQITSLEIGEKAPTIKPQKPQEIPSHRSHDPQFNQKRSDPFQFGSRYLGEDDDVFEFNAWDHVETDDAYKEYAEQQFAMQRQSPVSDYDKHRFNSDPSKWWNNFYTNNTANFFKDRKWLQQEFPVLDRVTAADAGPVTILEVGAGAGNTAFPILARNKNSQLRLHACDFSRQAVQVMRAHEAYSPDAMRADVWDVAGDELPPGLGEGCVDVALMVFVFSALNPSQWAKAVDNLWRVLKPGGEVCFRDYGRGDLAQVRFRKGRYLDENFYVRGDGTRVYFFDRDELAGIWSGNSDRRGKHDDAKQARTEQQRRDPEGEAEKAEEVDTETRQSGRQEPSRFVIEELAVDRRLLVNRARKLKMYRCWIQGRFRKKAPGIAGTAGIAQNNG